jgi:hypothetical protein
MKVMTARSIGIWLLLSLATSLFGLSCDRTEKKATPKAKPSWVSRVDLVPLGTRPAFDGNVELMVTLTNKSKYAVVMDRLDKDGEVQLAGVHGAHAALHPLSVGVAKPILLAPGDTVHSSFLFKHLDEPAQQLELYGTKRSVADTAGSR